MAWELIGKIQRPFYFDNRVSSFEKIGRSQLYASFANLGCVLESGSFSFLVAILGQVKPVIIKAIN